VQAQDGPFRNWQLPSLRVNELERVAIAPHLFLPAVAQQRLAQDQGPDPRLVHRDALYPVGRNGALGQGVFPQRLKPLRHLPGKQLLLTARFAEVG